MAKIPLVFSGRKRSLFDWAVLAEGPYAKSNFCAAFSGFVKNMTINLSAARNLIFAKKRNASLKAIGIGGSIQTLLANRNVLRYVQILKRGR